MTQVKVNVRPPWVIVADGFHRDGGMEKANAALASYLAEIGTPVHLVCNRAAPEFAEDPRFTVHRVARQRGPFFMREWQLGRLGRSVIAAIANESPAVRAVVNGTNCDWPDVNWVHFVHRAWIGRNEDAPAWFRVKDSFEHELNVRHEISRLKRARVLLANSERTRRDLIERIGLSPRRVHTVYLGADPDWKMMGADRREAARRWLGESADRPLVVFVGALGHDARKGFDTLFRAWQNLCARPQWDADLIVAGGGRALTSWKKAVEDGGMAERVKMLGFTTRIGDLLAAADMLVSPVRYESYGLNVHEAICCGVPAIVSAGAGVAERYPAELQDMLLPDPEDWNAIAEKLLRWRADMGAVRQRFHPLAMKLRAYTWRDMAERIVTTVEESDSRAPLREASVAAIGR